MNFFKICVLCSLAIFILGCSTQVNYVELERVDQEIGGNQGYIMGTPPPEYEKREIKPMQMIEIEVDVTPMSQR